MGTRTPSPDLEMSGRARSKKKCSNPGSDFVGWRMTEYGKKIIAQLKFTNFTFTVVVSVGASDMYQGANAINNFLTVTHKIIKISSHTCWGKIRNMISVKVYQSADFFKISICNTQDDELC